MLRLKLELMATEKMTGFDKGEILELYTNVFDKQNGIAFEPLDKRWKVIKMQIVEYRPLDIEIENLNTI